MLVSGRRGVFDGVIEGLHQHWKYREVAKVVTMQRLFRQVIYTATLLEAESSGILVSVNKLKDGHAIIIYRGKNYRRPVKPVPENLLTKREALHRSLEMQRIGVSEVLALSLFHHLLVLLVFLSIPLCHHVVSDFDLNNLFIFIFFVSVAEVFCLSETADNHRFETEIGNLDS
jgi:RNA-binding protein YhbY